MSNQHGYRCPKCGEGDWLDVLAQVWARLVPNGADIDEAHDRSLHWEDQHEALCGCGWHGTVADLGEPAAERASTEITVYRFWWDDDGGAGCEVYATKEACDAAWEAAVSAAWEDMYGEESGEPECAQKAYDLMCEDPRFVGTYERGQTTLEIVL